MIREVAGNDREVDARRMTARATEVDPVDEPLADLDAAEAGTVAHAAPLREGRLDVQLRSAGYGQCDHEEDEIERIDPQTP